MTSTTFLAQLSDPELFTRIQSHVKAQMARFDASHDFEHILRVLALSNRILSEERKNQSLQDVPLVYDNDVVFLAALLHDLHDKKYISTISPSSTDTTPIATLLVAHGASRPLAETVQAVCQHVSYSTEVSDPRRAAAVLAAHPELAVVQDADRLDALGAVGIARSFTYGAAKRDAGDMRDGRGLEATMEHFRGKLVRLEGLMKESLPITECLSGKVILQSR